ncbi:C40 family peptidase [Oryzihumus sp.]|uniref:C40 family peptidase n=1 Tax=Oryzihumus sp. TaxID=1968903 RepID=UPI002ED846E8
MSKHHAGRHRVAAQPTNVVAATLGRSGHPAAKASAVMAVSGGLVASIALPASAAPAADHPAAGQAAAPAGSVAAAAPASSAPVAPSFGDVGFTGVAPKPAPAPAPAPKAVQVSRSTARPAVSINLPSAVSGVLGIASQYAGVPYKWGGTTPQEGFDCSGYTSYVFAQLGKHLPRTAEDQRQAVTRVSDPQPGDLVFFGSPAYHVGIYAGGGMMWDAPHSGSSVAERPVWNSGDVSYGRVS